MLTFRFSSAGQGVDFQEPFNRRKIRLIESNAKYRYLKKLTCKGTLRQVFYLSEAPSPPMTPLIHTGKGGGGERANQREG
jgi:hypothetical protein